jgi:dihydrofolate synthase / folylpolyglutamate synthase
MAAKTLQEWLTLQESVHPTTMDFDLARLVPVARALGVTAPDFAVLTVAGTNGKGSIAVMLEALLRARGARTGVFTSPHLLRYNERVRLDGNDVADAPLIAAFERIEAARGNTTLTFFEYNTLAALLVFGAHAVEVAVLEVGLGGRLDATNLVDADTAVLASVGFDHRDWLGNTLELIGAEKAGIFRPGRPAVLGSPDMPASVYEAIRSLGAQPVIAGRDFSWHIGERGWDYSGLALSLQGLPAPALAGSIQYRNAATALAALEALTRDAGRARPAVQQLAARLTKADAATTSRALREVRLPGRFQVVPGPVEWILDIAHNEPAARVLAAQLAARPLPRAGAATRAVIGVLADKDAPAIAAALHDLIDHWFVCTLPGARGLPAPQLAARLGLPPERMTLAAGVKEGCELAARASVSGDRVVVCGSLHTVGPALEWLRIY